MFRVSVLVLLAVLFALVGYDLWWQNKCNHAFMNAHNEQQVMIDELIRLQLAEDTEVHAPSLATTGESNAH